MQISKGKSTQHQQGGRGSQKTRTTLVPHVGPVKGNQGQFQGHTMGVHITRGVQTLINPHQHCHQGHHQGHSVGHAQHTTGA